MFENSLIILFLWMLFGLVFVLLIPYKYTGLLKFSSFSTALVTFVWSLWLVKSFLVLQSQDPWGAGFYFVYTKFDLPLLGIDGLSLLFIVLTTFIFFCTFLIVWRITKRLKLLVVLLLMLELLLLLVFSVLDLFLFYIVFEIILLPMVLIILLWGSRARKIKASYYFFLYTLFGSLLMLVGIIFLYFEFGTTNLALLSCLLASDQKQVLLWMLFFFSFAIKVPMFPFHIWLPEAHVEAPTIGSVLLAGLLLKLGGYGFLRILLPLFPSATLYFQPFVLTLSGLGVVYSSLILLRQIDIKKIIAYSSVAHMNFAMLGLFSNTYLGIHGSLYLLVSHGFSSSALFLLAGVLYERHHTRLISYYGGLIQLMPLYGTFFFLFTIANFGFPGTSNFLGEFSIFLAVANKSFFVFFCAGIGMFFSVIYSILLFNRILYGELKFYFLSFSFNQDLNKEEFIVLLLFAIVLVYFGIAPISILKLLTYPTVNLLI